MSSPNPITSYVNNPTVVYLPRASACLPSMVSIRELLHSQPGSVKFDIFNRILRGESLIIGRNAKGQVHANLNGLHRMATAYMEIKWTAQEGWFIKNLNPSNSLRIGRYYSEGLEIPYNEGISTKSAPAIWISPSMAFQLNLENPFVECLLCMKPESKLIVGQADKENLSNKIDIAEPTALKNHAEIFYHGNLYWIKAIGNPSRTFINGKKLTPNRYYLLRFEDQVLFAANTIIDIQCEAGKQPQPTTIVRDGIIYALIKDPPCLENGTNIFSKHSRGARSDNSEMIAIRDDRPTAAFLKKEASFAQRYLNNNNDPTRLAGFLSIITRKYFMEETNLTQVFDSAPEELKQNWEALVEKFPGQKISLGHFIAIGSGCCRHMASALQLLYQEVGYDSKFPLGKDVDPPGLNGTIVSPPFHASNPTNDALTKTLKF